MAVLTTGAASPLGLPFSAFANVAMMADGRVAFVGSAAGTFRRTDAGVVARRLGRRHARRRQAGGGREPAGARTGRLRRGARVPGRRREPHPAALRRRRRHGGRDRPAAPGGGTFAEFTAGVAYGVQGQIAFTAILDDGNTGLFLQAGSAGTSIARTGESTHAGPYSPGCACWASRPTAASATVPASQRPRRALHLRARPGAGAGRRGEPRGRHLPHRHRRAP